MRRLIHRVTMLGADGKGIEGYLIIQEQWIEAVGSGICPEPMSAFDDVIDGAQRLLLPGFINTHGHAAMSLLRGYADDMPLQTWLQEKIWPAESTFTADDVEIGTQLAMLEMIETGTTTFTDMYFHMDRVAESVIQSGMRAVLGRGLIGLDNDGAQKLAESESFARAYHGAGDGRVSVIVSPHAPYTCPPEYLQKVIESADQLNLPVQIHIAETAKEVVDCMDQYGTTPVMHLYRSGLFRLRTIGAHCVHLSEEDIAILASQHVSIAHNPGSNLKLGSGIAPLTTLLAKGIVVGLGTDGAASNNKLDMWEELRLVALLHKGMQQDAEAVDAATALHLATAAGAQALFMADGLGTLRPGAPADLQLIDISGPRYFPRHSLLAHVVYSSCATDVTDVFVAGRPLLRKREYLTIDKERVLSAAQQTAVKFTHILQGTSA